MSGVKESKSQESCHLSEEEDAFDAEGLQVTNEFDIFWSPKYVVFEDKNSIYWFHWRGYRWQMIFIYFDHTNMLRLK